MKTYPLAENTLNADQMMLLITGKARKVEWSQIKDVSRDELEEVRKAGMIPYLFDDGVHMLSKPSTF